MIIENEIDSFELCLNSSVFPVRLSCPVYFFWFKGCFESVKIHGFGGGVDRNLGLLNENVVWFPGFYQLGKLHFAAASAIAV